MKLNNNLSFKLSSVVIAVSSCLVGAHANENSLPNESDIEVITVTSDLLNRSITELPASAFVLDSDVIESKQARHLQDLVSAIPNLNFNAGASRGRFVQIRGIGERSQFLEPNNPSIGLFVDDIDVSGLGAFATVFDLAQVEVLSGPQSVGTGFTGLGGSIKLVSNSSTDALYAKVTGSVAQYDETQLSAVVSNSLSENVAFRLSTQNTQSNGFVENEFLNRDDTNGIDETTVSAQFDIELNENTRLDLNAYYFDIDNGYDAFSLDNDNITQSDQPGHDKAEAFAWSAKLTTELSAHVLQATVFQLNADTDYAYDEDWTYDGFHPWGYTSFDQYVRDIERTGFDVKISNDSVSDYNYVVGLKLSEQTEDFDRFYTYSDDYTSSYEPSSYALYGQFEYGLNENLNVTVGARVENFTADFNDSDSFVAYIDDRLFAGVITFDYSLNDNLLFASLSRGYKAGGFNIDQRLDDANRTYDPEYNNSVELGIKGQAFDGMTNLSLTFFYMARQDAQVNDVATFEEQTDSGATITSFADAIGNSDTGTNQGIELSTSWYITDAWTVDANFGYLDARIDDYVQLNGNVVDEADQAQAPSYTAYLGSNLQVSDNVSWFIDVEAKDDYLFSDSHDYRAPSTLVFNTELTWETEQVSVSAWIKNIFDETIYTRGFGSFSNDPRDEYAFVEPYYQFGQERQIGVTVSYTWE